MPRSQTYVWERFPLSVFRAWRELERRYIAASNGDGAANGHADLKEVAEGWLRQVR